MSLVTELLAASYVYMPGLALWLHWAIYAGAVVVLGAAVTALWVKLSRLDISPSQFVTGVARAWRENPGRVMNTLLGDVVGQRRVRRDRFAGGMHLLIFWSFTMLLVGTTLIGVQHDLTSRLVGVEYLHGTFYLVEKFLLDCAALGLLVGVTMAVWRRYVRRPTSLGARRSIAVAYLSLAFMGLSGLVLEATRELAFPVSWAWWTFAGHLSALAIGPLLGAHVLGGYELAWGVHVIAAFAFMTSAAMTTLDHAVMVPANLVLGSNRTSGLTARPFDLAAVLDAEGDLENLTAGFASPFELPWDRRFMIDSCINCGRCEAVCPATASGRPLSPRTLIQSLRTELRDGDRDGAVDVFTSGRLDEETVWSCLTCSACRQECPVGIDQPGVIVDLRRHLAEQGRLDDPKAAVLSALERNQNPLGLPSYQRSDWLAELGVATIFDKPDAQYLYWIGCMASYDQRARNIARSMFAIMDYAGVSYAVLGEREQCHGESQRRLGDEAGFQMRTMEIVEVLRGAGVRRILTHCPHCMNTFANDYREFGVEFEVVHHSQLLATLIESGRLPIEPATLGPVAYHDPCNLGRILGVFDAPRVVARASVGTLVEFERSGDRSFCCGAGGANYFYKAPATQSVSGLRLDQARAVGATMVATACPFCMAMLEDASRAGDATEEVSIMDLSELVASRLPSGTS
ncbi:MAG TPA: (Fe-S)-binding protein [Acidimicrobiales bacterium]|nr:(Fe-S)-binding protein [Acidimicrobiales bacterium]